MRSIHVAIAGLLCLLLARPAAAVSVDDLFNLKANGLSDDVLVALIETDGSIFFLSAEDVVALYRRGLSEKVILAMIASGRRANAPAPSLESGQIDPISLELPPSPPISVGRIPSMQQSVVQNLDFSPTTVVEVPVYIPVAVLSRRPHGENPRPSTTYWGFGGQLRPDAWQPARNVRPRDDKPGPDRGKDDKTAAPTKSDSSAPTASSKKTR